MPNIDLNKRLEAAKKLIGDCNKQLTDAIWIARYDENIIISDLVTINAAIQTLAEQRNILQRMASKH